jgi:predicted dehydrogenase
LCATEAEADQLIGQALAAGQPITVFQNRRWDGDFLTLSRVVRSGELGEVRQLESRFERWKPAGAAAKPWRVRGPHEAGGVVYDLGSHLIDQAIQLLGPVVDIHAEIASHSGTEAPDDGFLSLRHVDGARSRLWTSSVAAQPGPRFRVLGSDGAFVSWGLDVQEAQLASGLSPHDPAYGLTAEAQRPIVGIGDASEPVRPERGDYPAFYRGVALALRGRAELPVDARDSAEVVRILEQAHRDFVGTQV